MADDERGRTRVGTVRLSPELEAYLWKWQRRCSIIVGREDDPRIRVTKEFADFFVPPGVVRPAPFPFNLSETWYCGGLIATILLAHEAIDEGPLFTKASPYLQWGARVLGRVLLTLGAAVLSTLSFEVVGSILSMLFHVATTRIEDWVSTVLIKRLHWGEVDQNGEPVRGDGDFLWIQNEYPREAARETIQGLTILIFDYIVTLFLELGNQLIYPFIDRLLGPALYFFFAIPVDFITRLLDWAFLPTPGLDDIRDPRQMWLEYGVPVVIQLCLVVFLWLLKILYHAKAQRIFVDEYRLSDPKLILIMNLIRATAMHLIAYTAYQLTCGILVALRSELPQGSWCLNIIDGPIVPFLGRVIPNGRFFAAALLFFFHWIFRDATVRAVKLVRPFWIPYLLWQSQYTEEAVDGCLDSHVRLLVDDVSSLLDTHKRVTSRVAMTALFGLRSSWPARFQLDSEAPDN